MTTVIRIEAAARVRAEYRQAAWEAESLRREAAAVPGPAHIGARRLRVAYLRALRAVFPEVCIPA